MAKIPTYSPGNEYPLTANILQQHANLICMAVASGTAVTLFKCDTCHRLHMVVEGKDSTGR